jgi:hypothetical protein
LPTLKTLHVTAWKKPRYRWILRAMNVLPRAGRPTMMRIALSDEVPIATSSSTGLSMPPWPPAPGASCGSGFSAAVSGACTGEAGGDAIPQGRARGGGEEKVLWR